MAFEATTVVGPKRSSALDAARALTLVLAAVALTSCGQGPRRFPLSEPLWEDPDQQPIDTHPQEYYSGLIADGADQIFFRPLAQAFALPAPGESRNVNAIDEVPNSSWFTNRIGFFPMTAEELARGACDGPDLDPSQGRWTVVAAKPNGANPGFFIKAPTGRYLLKFDGPLQPERATAADVIGSKIFYAAGYNAPCNQIVRFRREQIEVDAKATATDAFGKKKPITRRDVEKVLAAAVRTKDGWLRASASKFLPGKPIGPFRYEGRRADDPNDAVPHEDRRELRGARLLSAWLNHFDAREQNSLDLLVEAGGQRFIRHYYIDFGDCFGSLWAWDPLARRIGHSHYFDFADSGADLVSLGTIRRPWHSSRIAEEAEIFGYFGVDDFVPSRWKPGYGNPAFQRMTHRDALWMVRIMSRFGEEQITAMVKTGELTNPRAERYLLKTLLGRRQRIMREYLTRYSPLERFRLVRRRRGEMAQSICFEDMAIREGVADRRRVFYKLRMLAGRHLRTKLGWLQFEPDAEHPYRSCVLLPFSERRPADLAPPGAPDDHALRYSELKIFVYQTPTSRQPTSTISVFLYDLGAKRGFRLVGIDRPEHPSVPVIN